VRNEEEFVSSVCL